MQCSQCQKKKKSHPKCCKNCSKDGKVKKPNWSLRFNCAKLKRNSSSNNIQSTTSSTSSATSSSSSVPQQIAHNNNSSHPLPSQISTSPVTPSTITPIMETKLMDIDSVQKSNPLTALGSIQFLSTQNPTSTVRTFTNNTASASSALLVDSSTLCSGGNVFLVSMNQHPQPLLDFTRYEHS